MNLETWSKEELLVLKEMCTLKNSLNAYDSLSKDLQTKHFPVYMRPKLWNKMKSKERKLITGYSKNIDSIKNSNTKKNNKLVYQINQRLKELRNV